MKRKYTIERELKILEFCSNEKKHISEIVNEMNMSIHTLRAKYIYPLVREKKLKNLGHRWYIKI
tara:strand:- start:89 stop:280 length:192 start_codon:yes stop_codon:yes gene_type:complete